MNIVLLTADRRGALSVQQIHLQLAGEHATTSRRVNLVILDARRMSEKGFAAACAEVGVIRHRCGMHHGVLLSQAPTTSTVVAAIRCGLRDMVDQYVTAAHLRRILRAANPDLRARDLTSAVSFLRTFNGLAANETALAELAHQQRDVERRAEELTELAKRLEQEKAALERRDRDLRERTLRFDRQLARLQTDADVAPPVSSAPPFVDLERARQLDKRAADLDRREKLLLEMQNLLLQTPVGEALLSHQR